jgi:hypothetical protein
MRTLLIVLLVVVVAGGLYALAAGGVAGLVGGARSKAKGDEDPLGEPPARRRAPGDR